MTNNRGTRQTPSPPAEAATAPAEAAEVTIRPLWQVEKEAIEAAIRICRGNIPKAAAYLGISASTIYRKRSAWRAREGY